MKCPICYADSLNLIGLGREIPAVYVSVLLQQDAVCPYIDVAQEYGLSGDVCPMPEAEAGVSIADDFPIFGACAIQCNTTCDGSMMGNGIMARRLEGEHGIPCFQLAAPMRHTEDGVQEYAAQNPQYDLLIEDCTGEKWDWMRILNVQSDSMRRPENVWNGWI